MFCDQICHCLRAKIEEYKTLKVHLDRGIDFQILGMERHLDVLTAIDNNFFLHNFA